MHKSTFMCFLYSLVYIYIYIYLFILSVACISTHFEVSTYETVFNDNGLLACLQGESRQHAAEIGSHDTWFTTEYDVSVPCSCAKCSRNQCA